MRYFPIDSQLFVENRKRLAAQLKPNSIAILTSNDVLPTNADGTLPFKQNSDIFYLSGIDQEETLLVIFPDAVQEKYKEILFIKETNETIAIWEGNKLSKEEAIHISGVQTICWLTEMESVLNTLIFESENIYLNSNEHLRNSNLVETRERRLIDWIKGKYPLHHLQRLAPILGKLRVIKNTIEIAQIKQAIEITNKAFLRTLKFIKPNLMEFEIEAEITHEFIKNRANGHAYAPIIATGKNACVLHYIENNCLLKDGELLLMDFGAEYANYAADLTRTVPVNGKFSARQLQVYNSVLNIQKKAIKLLITGNNLEDYQKEVGKFAEEELVNLGLLKMEDVNKQDEKKPLYKKYFMHGASHFLGLDVHDVGNRNQKFENGMLFTCEPGIYIKEENIGIRIENNILITENGNFDLMSHIPREASEIEEIMQSGK
jgi:Xaa-Pro aminopeptidase